MSRHETWRTEKYWESQGGYLILEFPAIRQDLKNNIGRRLIDGVIILGDPKGVQTGGSYNIANKDIIVIQTKANRLGMYLMGQALFSREIMKRYKPRSIRTVAICGKMDSELLKLCHAYDIEVEVMPDE